MNAQEARETLKQFELPDCELKIDYFLNGKAKGYLEALNGPEVKGLVEALEKINKEKQYSCDCQNDCSCYFNLVNFISKEALSKFKQAVGK